MKSDTLPRRSPCPVTMALDLIGDKWSLVIIRDMCLGKTKYGDFQQSPESIPTNILANRLRQLEENGIIEKQAYQIKPLRHKYLLTEKGADLLPVLQALARWVQKYDVDCSEPPEGFYAMLPADLLLNR